MSSNLQGNDPATADVEQALERLFRLGANRRFDARQEAAVGAAVTRAGYAVLRCLSTADGLGMAALAEACTMDAAAASRQVERLVNDGLVSRQTDDRDGRAVDLTITARGRKVCDAIVEYRTGFLREVMGDWSRPDRHALAEMIVRLVEDLTPTPVVPAKTPNRADPEVRPARRG